MKRLFAFLLPFAFNVSAQAQTASVASNGQHSAMTSKDSMLCRTWKLVSIEEFSENTAPEDKQQNDGVKFSTDHRADVVQNGVNKKGIWNADKGKTSITVMIDDSHEKLLFKIRYISKDSLGLDFQDADLIHIKYNYILAE